MVILGGREDVFNYGNDVKTKPRGRRVMFYRNKLGNIYTNILNIVK